MEIKLSRARNQSRLMRAGMIWQPADAGFKKIEISIVAAEEQPPHFQTILASGEKS